jgi:hypothetical protein
MRRIQVAAACFSRLRSLPSPDPNRALQMGHWAASPAGDIDHPSPRAPARFTPGGRPIGLTSSDCNHLSGGGP